MYDARAFVSDNVSSCGWEIVEHFEIERFLHLKSEI